MRDGEQQLLRGAEALGLPLGEAQVARLLQLLEELERWSRAYNLTAIEGRERMVTHHLLDSLSVHPYIAGERIADVGTGAGFPGLPLAVVNPARHFTLIDSNQKKVRFVSHAARTLGLVNVEARHGRVEDLAPPAPFDCVLTRAFAPLPALLAAVRGLCGPGTAVLAMKGRVPEEELASLPPGWALERTVPLTVPGLDAARHLLVLRTATLAPA
jgi:16S rRNA (guanine527-N7)-methyltransferase